MPASSLLNGEQSHLRMSSPDPLAQDLKALALGPPVAFSSPPWSRSPSRPLSRQGSVMSISTPSRRGVRRGSKQPPSRSILPVHDEVDEDELPQNSSPRRRNAQSVSTTATRVLRSQKNAPSTGSFKPAPGTARPLRTDTPGKQVFELGVGSASMPQRLIVTVQADTALPIGGKPVQRRLWTPSRSRNTPRRGKRARAATEEATSDGFVEDDVDVDVVGTTTTLVPLRDADDTNTRSGKGKGKYRSTPRVPGRRSVASRAPTPAIVGPRTSQPAGSSPRRGLRNASEAAQVGVSPLPVVASPLPDLASPSPMRNTPRSETAASEVDLVEYNADADMHDDLFLSDQASPNIAPAGDVDGSPNPAQEAARQAPPVLRPVDINKNVEDDDLWMADISPPKRTRGKPLSTGSRKSPRRTQSPRVGLVGHEHNAESNLNLTNSPRLLTTRATPPALRRLTRSSLAGENEIVADQTTRSGSLRDALGSSSTRPPKSTEATQPPAGQPNAYTEPGVVGVAEPPGNMDHDGDANQHDEVFDAYDDGPTDVGRFEEEEEMEEDEEVVEEVESNSQQPQSRENDTVAHNEDFTMISLTTIPSFAASFLGGSSMFGKSIESHGRSIMSHVDDQELNDSSKLIVNRTLEVIRNEAAVEDGSNGSSSISRSSRPSSNHSSQSKRPAVLPSTNPHKSSISAASDTQQPPVNPQKTTSKHTNLSDFFSPPRPLSSFTTNSHEVNTQSEPPTTPQQEQPDQQTGPTKSFPPQPAVAVIPDGTPSESEDSDDSETEHSHLLSPVKEPNMAINGVPTRRDLAPIKHVDGNTGPLPVSQAPRSGVSKPVLRPPPSQPPQTTLQKTTDRPPPKTGLFAHATLLSRASNSTVRNQSTPDRTEPGGLNSSIQSQFPPIPEKLNFNPRPGSARISLLHPDAAYFAAHPLPDSSVTYDDSTLSVEQRRKTLNPLPPREMSPIKSCMRSPVKPKTPGRVVVFRSSVIASDTNEPATGRAVAIEDLEHSEDPSPSDEDTMGIDWEAAALSGEAAANPTSQESGAAENSTADEDVQHELQRSDSPEVVVKQEPESDSSVLSIPQPSTVPVAPPSISRLGGRSQGLQSPPTSALNRSSSSSSSAEHAHVGSQPGRKQNTSQQMEPQQPNSHAPRPPSSEHSTASRREQVQSQRSALADTRQIGATNRLERPQSQQEPESDLVVGAPGPVQVQGELQSQPASQSAAQRNASSNNPPSGDQHLRPSVSDLLTWFTLIPYPLSQTEWTVNHWMRLEQLTLARKSGQLRRLLRQAAANKAHPGLERKHHVDEAQLNAIHDRTIRSRTGVIHMHIQDWHVDVVRAFIEIVGGWDPWDIAKRLYGWLARSWVQHDKHLKRKRSLVLEREQNDPPSQFNLVNGATAKPAVLTDDRGDHGEKRRRIQLHHRAVTTAENRGSLLDDVVRPPSRRR